MNSNPAISIQNVSKQFKNELVLSNVNLECNPGEIIGIIGSNGSGKSVLLKMICGFIRPSAGILKVNEEIIGENTDLAQDIGILIESPGFLPQFSAYKNLEYLASIRGIINKDIIKKYLVLVGLNPDDKKPVRKFSLGMKQRLGIAQAIMESPKVLLLDEPMNGLDKHGVQDIRIILENLKKEGTAIILVSHIKDDIDTLCERVFEIDNKTLVHVR